MRPVGDLVLLGFAETAVLALHFPAAVLPNKLRVTASAVWAIVPVVFRMKVFVVHVVDVRK